MSNKCQRCGITIPEPDLTGTVKRELEWREFVDEHKVIDEKKVLICSNCYDEIEEIRGGEDG